MIESLRDNLRLARYAFGSREEPTVSKGKDKGAYDEGAGEFVKEIVQIGQDHEAAIAKAVQSLVDAEAKAGLSVESVKRFVRGTSKKDVRRGSIVGLVTALNIMAEAVRTDPKLHWRKTRTEKSTIPPNYSFAEEFAEMDEEALAKALEVDVEAYRAWVKGLGRPVANDDPLQGVYVGYRVHAEKEKGLSRGVFIISSSKKSGHLSVTLITQKGKVWSGFLQKGRGTLSGVIEFDADEDGFYVNSLTLMQYKSEPNLLAGFRTRIVDDSDAVMVSYRSILVRQIDPEIASFVGKKIEKDNPPAILLALCDDGYENESDPSIAAIKANLEDAALQTVGTQAYGPKNSSIMMFLTSRLTNTVRTTGAGASERPGAGNKSETESGPADDANQPSSDDDRGA